MPTFIVFAPTEPLGWGEGVIIACAVVVSGEVARGLLPWVNDLTIRYLPFFKAQELYEVTGATFLVLSSTLVFFIFNKEVAALRCTSWRSAIRWRRWRGAGTPDSAFSANH
jgi:hypothetical protein